MTIGERIKLKRTELGMSQEELARRLGYKDRSTVSYIEKNGENLGLPKVKEIAAALRTTPEYLMGWEVDPNTLQDAFDNPDRRILFSLSEKATDQQVKVAIQFMKTLLGEDE